MNIHRSLHSEALFGAQNDRFAAKSNAVFFSKRLFISKIIGAITSTAVAVMFTFSFGSAFADVSAQTAQNATAQQKDDLYAAEKIALAQVENNFNVVYKEIVDVETQSYKISAAAWDSVKADILKALSKDVTDATDSALKANGWDSAWNGKTGSELASVVYGSCTGMSTTALKSAITANDYVYAVKAAKAQFALDYADALATFDKVDLSLYSQTKKNADGVTYYDLAVKAIAAAKEALDAYVNDEAKVDDAATVSAVLSIKNEVSLRVATPRTGVFESYLVALTIGDTNIASGLYKLNPARYTDIKTTTELENKDVTDAATAATVKAKVQKFYAEYLTGTTNPDKTLAENYVTVYNWLADEGVITNPAVLDTPIAQLPNKAAIKKAVEDVTTLNAFAKKYAAELDAKGADVRDKEAIDKIVKEATTDLYALAAGVKNTDQTKYDTLADATAAIDVAVVKVEDYQLAFAKEVKKAALEKARKAALKNYYELEQAAVNAAYDAGVAKVEAAKDTTEVNNVTVSLAKIKTKDGVAALFGLPNTASAKVYTEAKEQFDALKKYVAYKNNALSSRDAAYITASDEDLAKALTKFYGEKSARTAAEVKALANDITAVADALPTVGTLAAAKAAAEAAVDAIPATVTVEDYATVEAAWKAANDYAEMLGKDVYTDEAVAFANKAKLTTKISDLHSAMALDLAKKSAAVDKSDKAALKAVQEEIDAFNKLCKRGGEKIFDGKAAYTSTTVSDALKAIKDKELAAVKAAIFAIPLNLTEADKATVENARKLYDAYVAEYTDYETPYDAVAAIGYDNYRALTVVSSGSVPKFV